MHTGKKKIEIGKMQPYQARTATSAEMASIAN